MQGRSHDISKGGGGGGGHTVSNIIVMAFSLRNIVGCFLKKRLTQAPQDPSPGYALAVISTKSRQNVHIRCFFSFVCRLQVEIE